MPSKAKKKKNRNVPLKTSTQEVNDQRERMFDKVKSDPVAGHHANDVTCDSSTDKHDADVVNVKADNLDDVRLFPSITPWIVTVVTFVVRVFYVTNPENWWVLHPDEVFQSMDVAHSEAYGYGFRPFEFISPAKGNNLSHYQTRETMLGMNALRSPVYPQFLALIAGVATSLGLTTHPFLLWKVTHVLITSSLPLAVAIFVQAAEQPADVASLAAVLIASSAHINVFGTHTIVNSFLAPFIFFALSRFLIILPDPPVKQKRVTLTGEVSKESGVLSDLILNKDDLLCSRVPNDKDKGFYKNNDTIVPELTRRTHPLSLPNTSDKYNSRNFDLTNCNKPDLPTSLHEMDPTRDSVSNDSGFDTWSGGSITDNSISDGQSDEEDVYCKTSVVCGDETPVKPSQPNQNFILRKISDKLSNKGHKSRAAVDFCAGLTLSLLLYIRPDSGLFMATVMIVHANPFSILCSITKCKSLVCLVVGAVVGIVFGVGNDFNFYEDKVVSPWQWFNFNVLSNMASQLYGTSGVNFYMKTIFFGNAGVTGLTCLFGFALLYLLLNNWFLNEEKEHFKTVNKLSYKSMRPNIIWSFLTGGRQHPGRLPSLFVVNSRYIYISIVLLLIYSCFGHKEERFIHNVLVVHLITVAAFVMYAVGKAFSNKFMKQFILCILTMSFCMSQWQAMPSNKETGVNQCLYFVSKQDDVHGLFLEAQFSSTFSYSLLHRNIPLLTILKKEFLEFDRQSLISSNRSCFVKSDPHCQSRYVSLNTVRNVINISNSRSIIKHLLDRAKTYNYAIVSSSKEFFRPAYTPIFKTDSYTVWRFSNQTKDVHHLEQMSAKLELHVSQQAMLEYEAEVLKQLGNYWAAHDRLKNALKYTQDRPKVLASMVFCMQRMGFRKEARRIYKECLRESDKENCSKGNEARVSHLGSVKLS